MRIKGVPLCEKCRSHHVRNICSKSRKAKESRLENAHEGERLKARRIAGFSRACKTYIWIPKLGRLDILIWIRYGEVETESFYFTPKEYVYHQRKRRKKLRREIENGAPPICSV